MRARAAVAALIAIFVIGIIHPAKALPLIIPLAAEDGSPEIAEAVRIDDYTGKVNLAGMLNVTGCNSGCVWEANKKATFAKLISKILDLSCCEFQSSKIVMSSGSKVPYWLTSKNSFIDDPTLHHNGFCSPCIYENIIDTVIYAVNLSQNYLWPMRRDDILAHKPNLLFTSSHHLESGEPQCCREARNGDCGKRCDRSIVPFEKLSEEDKRRYYTSGLIFVIGTMAFACFMAWHHWKGRKLDTGQTRTDEKDNYTPFTSKPENPLGL